MLLFFLHSLCTKSLMFCASLACRPPTERIWPSKAVFRVDYSLYLYDRSMWHRNPPLKGEKLEGGAESPGVGERGNQAEMKEEEWKGWDEDLFYKSKRWPVDPNHARASILHG